MVEQVMVAPMCVSSNRESHRQDRVLKGSLLRLSRCLHVATYTFIIVPPSSIGSHMAGKSPLPHFRVSAWAASRIHQFATCRTRHSHRSTRGHTVFMMMVTAIIVSAEARPSPGPHSTPYRSHHCPALRRKTSDMASLRLTSVSNCQSQKHGLLTTGLFIGNVAIHTNRFAPSASVFCLVFHHAGGCVALHKRVTIADHTGGSRDHGRPRRHFSRVQGLRSHPGPLDIRPTVEHVVGAPMDVPSSQGSHRQHRVFQRSPVRLSAGNVRWLLI